jgi:murein DD-endopeptidase MepM/ murein hydrolase activator NlpD
VNGLSNPDRIVAGMTLTVPPRSGAANFRVVSSGGAGNAGAAVPQAAGFIWPTRGSRVPDGDFGAPRPGRPSPTHTGLDLAAPSGTPVVAARSGKVVHAGPEGTYGNTVVIDHGDGFQTRSAHLSAWNVSTGQWVAQGQVIGLVGATGLATGPHLHFEVIQHGRFINPVRVLP